MDNRNRPSVESDLAAAQTAMNFLNRESVEAAQDAGEKTLKKLKGQKKTGKQI